MKVTHALLVIVGAPLAYVLIAYVLAPAVWTWHESNLKGVAWFLVLDLVVLAHIVLVPALSLWLPGTAR